MNMMIADNYKYSDITEKIILISKMLQPAPKSPSFRQGSRNPGPWMVTFQVK
jgi:hypothetical protein